MSVILWSFGIWSKQERWKNSVSGCLTIWPNIKKIVVLKCLLLFYTTMNHFLIRLWCTMKSRFYVIISDDQLRDCTKKLQSTNLHKKGHSQCLVICCLSDPLQLSESSETITSKKHAQQINETHWKLQHLQLVLVNRSAQFSMKTPNQTLHNQCIKCWMNWATKFCLTCHIHLTSHQLMTTSSNISTTFARKMLPQPARCRKCFPWVYQILKHGFLHNRNKQTYERVTGRKARGP